MPVVDRFGRRVDTKSKAQVAEEMLRSVQQVAAQVAGMQVQNALGPFAELFKEFLTRQSALEDAMWSCPNCRRAWFQIDGGTCDTCKISLEQYAYVPPTSTPDASP